MKHILVIVILLIPVITYPQEINKDTIKSGVSAAKGVLSHDNTTRPLARPEDSDIFGTLGNWKTNNMIRDVEAVSGGEMPMYSLDGKTQVDAKMACIGNTKIGELNFSSSGNSLSMTVSIIGGQSLTMKGITGICNDGFTVCDDGINKQLCDDALSRVAEGSKQNHVCNALPSKCRNWRVGVNNKKLQFETLSGNCSVISSAGQPEYDSLTNIVAASFSRGNMPIGNIESSGAKSVLYSINSDNCTMGGAQYGSGYTDMGTLGTLYDSKATMMPESSGVLAGAVNDNDSVYNLIMGGNKIDYGGGTIGSPTFSKCEINNIVVQKMLSEDKTSTFNGLYTLCTDLYINGRIRRDGGTVNIEFKGGGLGDPMKECYGYSGSDIASANGGWFKAYSFAAPANIKEIYVDYAIIGCGNGSGSFSLSGGESQSSVYCVGNGAKYPKIEWRYKMVYSEDKFEPDLTTTDTCKDMKQRSDCTIKEEKVCDNTKTSCVATVNDSKKTNTAVPNYCYDYSLGQYSVTACANGASIIVSSPVGNKTFTISDDEGRFNIQREYRCIPKPSGLDDHENLFSDMFGEIADGAGDVSIPKQCVTQFCVVERAYTQNNIYADTNTNSSIGNGESAQQFVKQCNMVGADMAKMEFECPTIAGERITSDCACDNEDQMMTNMKEVMTGLAILDELKKTLNCGEDEK